MEDVQDNGAVTDGFVSVYGTVRNTGGVGRVPGEDLPEAVRHHGVLLSTGETSTDLKIVGPGEAVTSGES